MNSPATAPVLRFAPSPNGALHLGHAYSALINERIATEINGRVLLRIEDLDRTRSKPQFVAAIVDDLAWLGLRFPPPRQQSEHADDYAAALARLDGQGLVYPCFCSRSEISASLERPARPGRRAALSRNVPRAPSGRSARPPRPRRQGRVSSRHAARDQRRPGASRLDRIWRGRRSLAPLGCAGGLGRRCPPRPRSGGELSSRGGGRRRVAGRYRRRARARSPSRDGGPSAAAGPARPCRATLPASPARSRPDGAKLSKSRQSVSLAELRATGLAPGEVRAALGFASGASVGLAVEFG